MSHIDDYPEKAKEQALIIESLKPYLHLLDTDYLKESNKKIREQASFQEKRLCFECKLQFHACKNNAGTGKGIRITY